MDNEADVNLNNIKPRTFSPWEFIKRYKIFIITIILAILAISLLIFVLILIKTRKTEEPKKEPERKEEAAPAGDFSLNLGPQRVGISLSLEQVGLPKTSWLVIHTSKNGQAGEILEEAIPPLNPGVYDKSVVILRTPLKVAAYFAALHIDDGDLKFDPQKDPLAKNQKGEAIIKGFIAR